MKSFTDVFPTPFGVVFEGGEFVAEFPEANRDAYIQNKKLNAWLACAKIHNDNYFAFNEYIMRLEGDLMKERANTRSLIESIEHKTKKLDEAIRLLQSEVESLCRANRHSARCSKRGRKHNGGARIYVGADPKFAKQSLQSKLDQFKKIYKDK